MKFHKGTVKRRVLSKLPLNVHAAIASFLPFRVFFAPHLLAEYLDSFPINHAKLEFVYHPAFKLSLPDCEQLYLGILEDYRARVKEIKIVGYFWYWQGLISFALQQRSVYATLRITITSPINFNEFVKQSARSRNETHRLSIGFKNMEVDDIAKHLADLVRLDKKLVALTVTHLNTGYKLMLPIQRVVPSLVCLQLFHVNGLAEMDISAILHNHPRLLRLEVVGAMLHADEIVQMIASYLLTEHSLKHLSLMDTNMTDIGGVALGSAMCSQTSLLTCHLKEKLGDASAYSFAEALLLNTTILALKFENCRFSTQGASSLVDVLQTGNSTLETLTFHNCGYSSKDTRCSYTWMGRLRCSRTTNAATSSSCSHCKWPYYASCCTDGKPCMNISDTNNGLHLKFREVDSANRSARVS